MKGHGVISMHEMSIAQSIVDIVNEEMTRHGVTEIKAINIAVGKMSAVVPEHLNMCFTILTDKTELAGVALNVREVPLKYVCHECSMETESETMIFNCPDCGVDEPEMIQGRELTVENIEVADE